MERERERDIRHSVSNVAAHGSRRIYFRIPRIPTPSLSFSLSLPAHTNPRPTRISRFCRKKGGHVFVEDRYNKMCRVNGSGFRFEENPVEVYPLGWLQLSAVGAACSSAAVALLSSQLLPLYLFLASLFFAPARQSHHFVAIFLCSFSSFSFLSIVRNSISNEEKIISSHVLLISRI